MFEFITAYFSGTFFSYYVCLQTGCCITYCSEKSLSDYFRHVDNSIISTKLDLRAEMRSDAEGIYLRTKKDIDREFQTMTTKINTIHRWTQEQ